MSHLKHGHLKDCHFVLYCGDTCTCGLRGRMTGRQIKTLEKLRHAAYSHQSVVCPRHPCWAWPPKPARFMMNLSGEIILRLMRSGMFVYKKPRRKDYR